MPRAWKENKKCFSLSSDCQQWCVLRMCITQVWSPRAMAANSIASPPLPLSLVSPHPTSSTWGVRRNWDRWLGKETVTSGRDGGVNFAHFWAVEKELESEAGGGGGRGNQKQQNWWKNKTGWGVNSRDWRGREYGTLVRSKVAGYREMRSVFFLIWKISFFFCKCIHSIDIRRQGIKSFFCLIMTQILSLL